MVRNYKRKTERGQATEEQYKAAASEVENGTSIREAARLYRLCYVTLSRYLKKASRKDVPVRPGYSKSRQIFTAEQELHLVQYLQESEVRHFGLSLNEAHKMAYQWAVKFGISCPPSWDINKAAGKDWLLGFRKRHKLSLPVAVQTKKGNSLQHFRENIESESGKMKQEVETTKVAETKPNNKEQIPFLEDLIKLKQESKESEEDLSCEDLSSHVCKIESSCGGVSGVWDVGQPGPSEDGNMKQIKDELADCLWSCIANTDENGMKSSCDLQHSQLARHDVFPKVLPENFGVFTEKETEYFEGLPEYNQNIEQIKEEIEDSEMICIPKGNKTNITVNNEIDLCLASREESLDELSEHRINELKEHSLHELGEKGVNESKEHRMNELRERSLYELGEQGVNELIEQGVNELIEQGVNELIEQGVNELREMGVNELREMGVNELIEQKVNELLEQKVNELIEQGVNKLREQGVNKLIEKRVNELIEQRVSELIEQRVSELIEQRLNELREHGVNELREQKVNELIESVKVMNCHVMVVDIMAKISLYDGRLALGNGACNKLAENEFCVSKTGTKCNVRSEDSENLYKCDVCGKGFTELVSLDTHKMGNRRKKSYKCDVCDLGFSHSSDLKGHKRRTHTNEKPLRCDVCGKEFIYSCHLNDHRVAHTGKTTFKCDICGKGFTYSSQLRVHKITHMKEKFFICGVCGKEFAYSSNLMRHKRTHIGV